MGFFNLFSNIGKTAVDSIDSVIKDQYVEYFKADSLGQSTLVKRATKVNSKGNNKGSDDVISSGSRILVPEGTGALFIDNGRITQVIKEAGTYEWSNSSASVLGGSALYEVKEEAKDRIRFGGELPNTQRVYYVNMLEIRDNYFKNDFKLPYKDATYGTTYLDFRVVFSFRICEPDVFYRNVGGCATEFTVRQLTGSALGPGQLATEVEDLIAEEINKLSLEGVPYASIMSHRNEIDNRIIFAINSRWIPVRGIELCSLTLNINGDSTTRRRIETADSAKVYATDPNMVAAQYVLSTTEAAKTAAANPAGAVTGMTAVNMTTHSSTSSSANNVARNASSNSSNNSSSNSSSNSNPNIMVKRESCPNCKFTPKSGVLGKFCENCGKPINKWWEV